MNGFMTAIGLYSYDAYMSAFEAWVAQGESSTPGASTALVGYTRLNYTRSKRIEKTVKLQPALTSAIAQLMHQYTFMIITESWCGDSAQNLPVIAAMAAVKPENIRIVVLLRHQHQALMDQYLTDGARAIPKVIVLNETTGKEAFTWGPRPAPAQHMLHQWKANPLQQTWDAFEQQLHTWYANDKTATLQQEWLALIQQFGS